MVELFYLSGIIIFSEMKQLTGHDLSSTHTEELTMALTEFGKAVRKARIDTGSTLLTMSQELETTPAFLSGLETGSKKIPQKWVKKIDSYFNSKGVQLEGLEELAAVANEVVPIDGLSQQQQMLVAGFAKSQFTPEQLKSFAELLQKINNNEV